MAGPAAEPDLSSFDGRAVFSTASKEISSNSDSPLGTRSYHILEFSLGSDPSYATRHQLAVLARRFDRGSTTVASLLPRTSRVERPTPGMSIIGLSLIHHLKAGCLRA
jgi:hypothetical protein